MRPYLSTDILSQSRKRPVLQSRKGVVYLYHKEGIVMKSILR
jgi:hypothetical protein